MLNIIGFFLIAFCLVFGSVLVSTDNKKHDKWIHTHEKTVCLSINETHIDVYNGVYYLYCGYNATIGNITITDVVEIYYSNNNEFVVSQQNKSCLCNKKYDCFVNINKNTITFNNKYASNSDGVVLIIVGVVAITVQIIFSLFNKCEKNI